ncbi:flagellar basal body rod protein FlgC [Polaribacter sp. Hel_I_88]|uniref:flagellar basal body rod protein FlgC n=1 Tax=Polaribacter sp. Hel_I_88 TaxID=1250006 RepID=UPI00047D359D|nr:flagellar basal body rod protein FlgC [Polaribacter sp. Hel_I_88]
MKKIILFISISLFYVLAINAQTREESREKIKALKVAYLTEQLSLTTEEAQKFWPIYNKFDKEQNDLRINYKSVLRQSIKSTEEIDSLNEADAKKLIALKLLTDKQLYESQKNFIIKMEGILSAKKIIKLQISEMDFARKLMKKYRKKRSDSKD